MLWLGIFFIILFSFNHDNHTSGFQCIEPFPLRHKPWNHKGSVSTNGVRNSDDENLSITISLDSENSLTLFSDRRQYLQSIASTAAIIGGISAFSSDAQAQTPSEALPWMDSNSFSALSSHEYEQIQTLYPVYFIEYLCRFLINFDSNFSSWWRKKMSEIPKHFPEFKKKEIVRNEFSSFYSSVFYGLKTFSSVEGPRDLASMLLSKYGSRPENFNHLSKLFSMIPSEYQPNDEISYSLKKSTDDDPAPRRVESEANLSLDMLPLSRKPLFDDGNNAYFISDLPTSLPWFLPELSDPPSKEKALKFGTYALFAAGGAFGCTVTHAAVIPLDVVKTRLQTNPGCYKNLPDGVITIAQKEGMPMLLQGAGPTLVGYLWYGLTVYPGYEFFKRFLLEVAGADNALLFRTPIVLLAGAIATFFACVGVCPAEAVRIRSVAEPNFAPNSLQATVKIIEEEGFTQLYAGFKPLLFRQVIFGMMKFFVFDFFAEFVYSIYPSLQDQPSTALTVSLISGLVAGVASCIVSQPADTILSTINKSEGMSIGSAVKQIWGDFGPKGFFLGLGSRCIWSGCVISGQFLLYDISKTLLHVTPSDLTVYLHTLAALSK